MFSIDNHTKVYASFSRNPGTFGYSFHNRGFDFYNMNCVYLPKKEVKPRLILDLFDSGIYEGISLGGSCKLNSYDVEARSQDIICLEKGIRCNTLYRSGSRKFLESTDMYSVRKVLNRLDSERSLFILGSGAYASVVAAVAAAIGKPFHMITRINIDSFLDTIVNADIFNATPLKGLADKVDTSNTFIDCDPTTDTGFELAYLQGKEQFRLYTRKEYPYGLEKAKENYRL